MSSVGNCRGGVFATIDSGSKRMSEPDHPSNKQITVDCCPSNYLTDKRYAAAPQNCNRVIFYYYHPRDLCTSHFKDMIYRVMKHSRYYRIMRTCLNLDKSNVYSRLYLIRWSSPRAHKLFLLSVFKGLADVRSSVAVAWDLAVALSELTASLKAYF